MSKHAKEPKFNGKKKLTVKHQVYTTIRKDKKIYHRIFLKCKKKYTTSSFLK